MEIISASLTIFNLTTVLVMNFHFPLSHLQVNIHVLLSIHTALVFSHINSFSANELLLQLAATLEES